MRGLPLLACILAFAVLLPRASAQGTAWNSAHRNQQCGALPTTTPPPDSTPEPAGLSTGAIAGISAGGAGVVLGGSFLAYYFSMFSVVPPMLNTRRPFVIYQTLEVERAPGFEAYYY